MKCTSGHHYVYGTLEDCLTKDILEDTDDERVRQKLFHFMIETKGYRVCELKPRVTIETTFDNKTVTSTIDLLVSIADKAFMIVRYAAGSLVSRERSAIAAARLICKDHQLPFAVVTNGRDAELLDTKTGKVIGNGVNSIPSALWVKEHLQELSFPAPPTGKGLEYEYRILNAFDLERCCLPVE